MKKLVLATLLTGMAVGANAQSAFEGFYGQIAPGYESNSLKGSNGTVTQIDPFFNTTYSQSVNSNTVNANGMPLVIGAGYNFSVTNSFLLGVGIDYSLLNQSQSFSGTVAPATIGGFTFPGYNIGGQQLKVSNRLNVFVTPSYAIDKEKLAYIKAGYSQQKLDYTGINSVDGVSLASVGINPTSNSSATVSGYVLGLGYKQIISGGFYGFAEGNYMSYGGKTFTSTTVDPLGNPVSANFKVNSSAYTFLVGVGYRF